MEWIKLDLTGTPPTGVKDFAIGYGKDKNTLIIFGGTTAEGIKSKQTFLADLNTLQWSTQSGTGPQARSNMIYGMDVWGSYRNNFVISGGQGDSNVIFNDTWAFDINYNTWTQITNVISTNGTVPQLYSAVGGIDTTVQTGSNTNPSTIMWISHGTDGKTFNTDLWAQVFQGSLSTNGNNISSVWYKVPIGGEIPKGRNEVAGTVLPGGRIVMYGGCDKLNKNCAISNASSLQLAAGYNTNPGIMTSSSIWSSASTCLGQRVGAAMVMNGITGVSFASQAIVFGGKTSKGKSVGVDGEVGVMDARDGGPLPKTRSGAQMVAAGRKVTNDDQNDSDVFDILMFGGEGLDGETSSFNDLWILRLHNNPTSKNNPASNMKPIDFLKCIKDEHEKNHDENSGFEYNNNSIPKLHIILSIVSFIFLPIASTILRFGSKITWIRIIYGILILSSYVTAICGFAIIYKYCNDKDFPHFSTIHGNWISFAWVGYPRGKNSLLVKIMTKISGKTSKIDDDNEEGRSGGGGSGLRVDDDDNRRRISIRSNQSHGGIGGGQYSRNNIMGNVEEADEQAELEKEITNREVVVMTIPKRRLTVVN
ncbi:2518_t:CDS:2 [Diversispora eburnea]|uniref:2518_t:CDS:1 n=1 Tax=Diversispora eburnea TaxID=1213867 RepID=A0A9N8VSR6_9GLOM|nr:2518_t:CDS:2 [Diversispora eburnea]